MSDLQQKLIRALELRLEILRNGLAVPRDAHAIAQYEAMLELARRPDWQPTTSPPTAR